MAKAKSTVTSGKMAEDGVTRVDKPQDASAEKAANAADKVEGKALAKVGGEPEQSAGQSVAAYTGSDSVPDYMRADAGAGTEAFGADDVALPRFKLLQGTSPELETYNNAKLGDYFHTGAEIPLSGPIRIVPIYSDLQYILWNPRDSGGGILARAVDGVHWEPPDQTFKVRLDKKDGGADVVWKTAKTVKQSGLNRWGTLDPSNNQSPPAATKMYNFLFAFPDFPDLPLALFSFQRAALKHGAQFINKIRSMPAAPMWATVFVLESEGTRSKKNEPFKIPVLTAAGVLSNRKLYDHYTGLRKVYVEKGFSTADIATAQTADDAPDDAGSGSGGNDRDDDSAADDRPNY